MLLLGIDIGGTKTTVCLGNQKGEVLTSKRFLTRPQLGYRWGVDKITAIAKELCEEEGYLTSQIKAIGLSCPGPLASAAGKLIAPPNLKGWENAPLSRALYSKLKTPVFLENDGNAAALAVHLFGGHNVQSLIYLTASTGMGGGLILDGKLIRGVSDTAAEVGHFVLTPNGRRCPCGQRGCFEAYCGGKMFARYVREELKKRACSTKMLDLADGKPSAIDMEVIVKAVKANDRFAQTMWKEFIDRLAQGIGTLLMVINPELIVLGTIAIHAGSHLLTPLKERLKHYCWQQPLKAKIMATKLKTQISEKSSLAVAIYRMEIDGNEL